MLIKCRFVDTYRSQVYGYKSILRILEECIMVTTVQRTFLKEAPEALNIVKKVNHAVLISYSRKIESIDALSIKHIGPPFFRDLVVKQISKTEGRGSAVKMP